ncbi:MAG: nucleotidyltransferase domain-containing protein [Chloroflexaceae bacterium]|jgi:hypothetical protein|nr:nucleotidyltransferase domain-containing protein [Chloroflexaceae bacterium]
MSNANKWRVMQAQRIGALYTANPNVAAVVLGGSAGRGHADAYSDIELGVFWLSPPSDAERRTVIEQSGTDLLRSYPFDPLEHVWEDDLSLGRSAPDHANSGVLMEVIHTTTARVQQTLDAVLLHHDPDEGKQNIIAGVLAGQPLHNEPLLQHWKAQAASYPTELAEAVVRRHAQIDHFWRWRMWLARGPNLLMLYQSYAQVQQKLLHTLLGLNRVYYAGFKWLDVVAAQLHHAPPDLVSRLRAVFQVEPAEGAGQLKALVEETYDLLEQHMPQLDVERLRRIFRYQRPVWEVPPVE